MHCFTQELHHASLEATKIFYLGCPTEKAQEQSCTSWVCCNMTQKEQQVHQLSVNVPVTFSWLTKDTSSRRQPPLSAQGSTTQLYLKQTEFLRHISAWRERIALDACNPPSIQARSRQQILLIPFSATDSREQQAPAGVNPQLYRGFICRTTHFPFAEDASVIHNWTQELLSFTCLQRHGPTHVNWPLTLQIAN